MPPFIIAIHLLIKSGWWNQRSVKNTFLLLCLLLWALIGWLLWSNQEILFSTRTIHPISLSLGVIVLIIAGTIEYLTIQALGYRRILGDTELTKKNDALITTGIYAVARHPRYLEHPLWALGLGLATGYTIMLWLFLYLAITFPLVALAEERELLKRYGIEYENYRKRVPAFFIPFKCKENIQ